AGEETLSELARLAEEAMPHEQEDLLAPEVALIREPRVAGLERLRGVVGTTERLVAVGAQEPHAGHVRADLTGAIERRDRAIRIAGLEERAREVELEELASLFCDGERLLERRGGLRRLLVVELDQPAEGPVPL